MARWRSALAVCAIPVVWACGSSGGGGTAPDGGSVGGSGGGKSGGGTSGSGSASAGSAGAPAGGTAGSASGGTAGGSAGLGGDGGASGDGGTASGGDGGTGAIGGVGASGGYGATGGSGGVGGSGGLGGVGVGGTGFGGTGGTGGTAGKGGTGGVGGSGGAPTFCGDGKKNGGELCDGSDLGGATCAFYGMAGTLKCNSFCSYDSAGCYPICTPSCAGKQCGTDGCGGVCGSCSGESVCSNSGTCALCTASCPTLKTPSLPKSVQCTPGSSDCSTCGKPSCGGPRFSVTCSGTPVGQEYPGPDIPGCMWKQTNVFCCPAGCTRNDYFDALCAQKGLGGVGRACTIGAPMPSTCKQYPGTTTSTYVPACCAQ